MYKKEYVTNEKNSFLNKTPKIEFNFLAPAKKVPNFTPKILVALNKDKIIRRNFSKKEDKKPKKVCRLENNA